MVSCAEILVNKDSTSRLAINSELSYDVISLAKLKESLTVNWLWVRGSKIGIENLAKLYPGYWLQMKYV